MADPMLQKLREAVDDKGWIDDPTEMAPYLHEQRGRFEGGALADRASEQHRTGRGFGNRSAGGKDPDRAAGRQYRPRRRVDVLWL